MLDIYKKRLNSINLELTSACNFKCTMCYRNGKTISDSFLSYSDAANILKQLSRLDSMIKNLYFHWRGEPTLSNDLIPIIRLSNQYLVNAKKTLFTNGYLLDKDMISNLLGSNLYMICFSIDSINKDSYAKIRGANLDQTLNNLNDTVNLKKQLNSMTKVAVNVVVQDDNLSELKEIKQYFSESDIILNFRLDSRNMNKIDDKSGCKQLANSLFIGATGEISPCCMDLEQKLSIGNMFENSIEDILNNTFIEDLLESAQQRRNLKEVCSSCSYYNK